MNAIQLPKEIWSYKLSPNAFRTYCGLLGAQIDGCANISGRELAESVGASERSMNRGRRELQGKKLIIMTLNRERYRPPFYTLLPLHGQEADAAPGDGSSDIGIAQLPDGLFAQGLLATEIMTYACIRACAAGGDMASPSLRELARVSGLVLGTVITCVKELERQGLIRKTKSVNPDGSHNNNAYTFPIVTGVASPELQGTRKKAV